MVGKVVESELERKFEEKLRAIAEEIEGLDNEIGELRYHLEHDIGHEVILLIDALESRVDGLESRADELEARLDSLHDKIAGLKKEIRELEHKMQVLQTQP